MNKLAGVCGCKPFFAGVVCKSLISKGCGGKDIFAGLAGVVCKSLILKGGCVRVLGCGGPIYIYISVPVAPDIF